MVYPLSVWVTKWNLPSSATSVCMHDYLNQEMKTHHDRKGFLQYFFIFDFKFGFFFFFYCWNMMSAKWIDRSMGGEKAPYVPLSATDCHGDGGTYTTLCCSNFQHTFIIVIVIVIA